MYMYTLRYCYLFFIAFYVRAVITHLWPGTWLNRSGRLHNNIMYNRAIFFPFVFPYKVRALLLQRSIEFACNMKWCTGTPLPEKYVWQHSDDILVWWPRNETGCAVYVTRRARSRARQFAGSFAARGNGSAVLLPVHANKYFALPATRAAIHINNTFHAYMNSIGFVLSNQYFPHYKFRMVRN